MVEILCHIVGINCLLKEQFIKDFGKLDKNIIIKDIDEITHKIRNNVKMINYVKGLSKLKRGSNSRSNMIKKINDLWKTNLSRSLENIKKKNKNKKIIFLGLSTYHKNHSLKVSIDTLNKFILNINPKKNARNIVEYNIDKYKRYIINGSFPLRYIDHNFLIKQRMKIVKIYKNIGYKSKSLNYIYKWLGDKISNNYLLNDWKQFNNNYDSNDENYIYIGSKKNYDKKFKIRKNFRKSSQKIAKKLGIDDHAKYGYTKKWLAILKSINGVDNYIKKGYLNENGINIPFIEEKCKDGFKKLDGFCYLYKFPKELFKNKIDVHKYEMKNNIEFVSKTFIPKRFEVLKKSVRLIDFKNL